MTDKLHKVSLDASSYASGWLKRQPGVKEESITDWLLDFFDQNSNQIRYYQFNRHEEAKLSGADWDWWILYPNNKGCFKIRVQAKRLRKGHNHYLDITRANKSGYQIDMLLDSSSRLNFYPIYAHFGLSEGVERCTSTPAPESLFLSSAQEMYDLVFGRPRMKIESKDILKMCIPMPCLFGCPLIHEHNKIMSLFNHYFKSKPRNLPETNNQDDNYNRGFEFEIPPLIQELSRVDEQGQISHGLANEYQNNYEGSNAVAIFRVESYRNKRREYE